MKSLTLICMLVLGPGAALAQSFDDALPGFVIGGRANEPCPADSLTGQKPSVCPAQNTTWYFYSDLNFHSGTQSGRVSCENFPKTGVLDPNDPNQWIGTIIWYGINVDANSNGCTKGVPGTNLFRIRVYNDNAGAPDPNFVYEEVVTPTMVDTGERVLFAGGTILAIRWQYTAVLTTPRRMARGWFSICGTGSPTCWSLWEGSGSDGGDNKIYRWWEMNGTIPGPPITGLCDLNYCLGVKDIGACCDDRTSTCTEYTARAACVALGGRFLEGESTPCSAFGDPNYPSDPNYPNVACGEALGACCSSDRPCQQTRCNECYCPCSFCPGDFNCDGAITFDDINPFVDVLGGGPCCDPAGINCDVNGDGAVDFDDIDAFIAVLGQPCPPSWSVWLGPGSSCDDCCHLECNDPNQHVTHPELEECGQDTNGGCSDLLDPNDPNSPVDPNAWEDLGALDPNHPTVICGTLWAEDRARDTDWYRFTLPTAGTLAWETQSDIPLLSTPVFGDAELTHPTIAANCPAGAPLWGYWNTPRSFMCDLGGMSSADVFAGGVTYWWIAFPDSGGGVFDGFPCWYGRINYRITITHTPLPGDANRSKEH